GAVRPPIVALELAVDVGGGVLQLAGQRGNAVPLAGVGIAVAVLRRVPAALRLQGGSERQDEKSGEHGDAFHWVSLLVVTRTSRGKADARGGSTENKGVAGNQKWQGVLRRGQPASSSIRLETAAETAAVQRGRLL